MDKDKKSLLNRFTRVAPAATTKSNTITYAILIAAFLIVQIMLSTGNISSLWKGLLVPLCIYAILAVSLNLTVGILGELSLGHAGFMCVGAFAGAFFSLYFEKMIPYAWLRFPLALIVGGLVSALFGAFIGVTVLRLRGDYLAIVTLAFGEIVKNIVNILYIGRDSAGLHLSTESKIALNLKEGGEVLVNGAQGISGTPKDSNFYIAIFLVLVTVIVSLNLIQSRTGRAIMAIRDNRIAAESIGINITRYKLIAFVISSFFAGVAGVLYAHNLSTLTATPKNFGYNMSIIILVFVVLGGIGSIRGSIIAAVILTALPEALRQLNDYRMLIYAVVLILMMLLTSDPRIAAFRAKYSPKRLWAARKTGKENL